MSAIRSHRSGFTLVEVAVTLAVLAILVGAAVPSYANYLARQRLRHVAELLDLDLRRARTASVEKNVNVYLSFQSGRAWCWGMSRNQPCSCSGPGMRCDLGSLSASDYPGTLLQAGQPMSFEAGVGRAVGWNKVGLSNDRNHQIHIDLQPSGRPAMCGPDAPKASSC